MNTDKHNKKNQIHFLERISEEKKEYFIDNLVFSERIWMYACIKQTQQPQNQRRINQSNYKRFAIKDPKQIGTTKHIKKKMN